ncbi:hypothetical protein ACP9OK_25425 [Pseudomonas sp. B11]
MEKQKRRFQPDHFEGEGAWTRGTHAGCGFERFLSNKKPGAWAGFFHLEVPKTLPKITSKTLKS